MTDFLGISFLAYSDQPAWSTSRVLSMYFCHGILCGNYYFLLAVLENNLSINSKKTGVEESAERPTAQTPSVHL